MSEIRDERIRIKLGVDGPIDLEELISSFSGVSNQYKKTIRDLDLRDLKTDAKIYVTKIEAGCVEYEVALFGIFFAQIIEYMDYTVILTDFYKRLKKLTDFFKGKGKKPANFDKGDCEDIKQVMKPLLSRKGSLNVKRVKYHKKTKEEEVLLEFDLDKNEVAKVSESAYENSMSQFQ